MTNTDPKQGTQTKRQEDDSQIDQTSKPEDHVKYEIFMFFSTYRELTGDHKTAYETNEPRSKVLGNALLESFLVHTRNILHFLYENGQRDDITAGYFLQKGDKYPLCKPSPFAGLGSYDDFLKEVNKQIVHISKHRTQINPDKKEWNLNEIKSSLCPKLLGWIDDADKINSSTKKEISDLLKVVCTEKTQSVTGSSSINSNSNSSTNITGAVYVFETAGDKTPTQSFNDPSQ